MSIQWGRRGGRAVWIAGVAAACCATATLAAGTAGAKKPAKPKTPAAPVRPALPPAAAPEAAITPEAAEFFEKEVRPVLAASCYACHGPKLQQAGLRLDSLAAMLRGTDLGVRLPQAGRPGQEPAGASVEV